MLKGTAIVYNIPNGDYVLVESKAPLGYEANTYAIRVHVDDSGVYTHVGSESDGIATHRDVGKLVSTMKQFATDTNLDNTLTVLRTQLQVCKDTTFPANESQWTNVAGANQVLHYDVESKDAAIDYRLLDGDWPLTADEGWTRVSVTQPEGYEWTENGKDHTWKPDERLKDVELRQLFTIVPFVQVANQAVGDLAISKTVEGYEGMLEEDKKKIEDKDFTFTVNAWAKPKVDADAETHLEGDADAAHEDGAEANAGADADAALEDAEVAPETDAAPEAEAAPEADAAPVELLQGSYTLDILDAEGDPVMGSDQKPLQYTLQDGTAEFTLKHGQTARVRNLPVGTTFSVEEQSGLGDGWSLKSITSNNEATNGAETSDVQVDGANAFKATGSIKDTDSNPRTAIVVRADYTNKFEVRPAAPSIRATKDVDAETWPDNKSSSFTFLLEPYNDSAGSNPDSDPAGIEYAKEARVMKPNGKLEIQDAVFSFDPFETGGYTVPGTYRYVLREKTTDHEAGVSYSPALYFIQMKVSQHPSEARLVASYQMWQIINEDGEQNTKPVEVTGSGSVLTAKFRNSYSSDAANYRIRGTKVLMNGEDKQDPADNKYTFRLTPFQGGAGIEGTPNAPMPDANADGVQETSVDVKAVDGLFVFPPIHFTEPEENDPIQLPVTCRYKIEEVDESAAGITYDKRYFVVSLKLENDDKSGALKVTPSYHYVEKDPLTGEEVATPWTVKDANDDLKNPEFTNTYAPTTPAEEKRIGGTKELQGRGLTDGESFTFALEGTDEFTQNAIKGKEVEGTTVSVATLDQGKAEFCFDGLQFKKKGTYRFKMVEQLPEGVTFENPVKDGTTYDTKSYPVVVEVVDEFKENAQTGSNELTGNLLVKSLTVNGKVIEGTEADKSSAFVNTYAESGSYEFKASKVMSGRAFEVGDAFTFQMEALDDGAPLPTEGVTAVDGTKVQKTITITEADKDKNSYDFSFGSVAFTKPGTYNYKLTEVGEDLPAGVTRDETSYNVKLEVTSNASGTLQVASEVTGGTTGVTQPTWTNTYKPKPAKFSIQCSKILMGRSSLEGESFTMQVTPTNDTKDKVKAGVVAFDKDADGNPKDKVTFTNLNKGMEKSKALGEITITEKGTYTFEVRELMPQDDDSVTTGYQKDGVTYDQSVWEVTVNVDDVRDVSSGALLGTLYADVKLKHSTNLDQVVNDRALFVNNYKEAGTYALKGVKKITGRDFTPSDAFTFEITPSGDNAADAPKPVDADGNPVSKVTVNPQKGSTCVVDFGTMNFTSKNVDKQYTYTLSEVAPSQVSGLSHMTYDPTRYTLTLDVASNSKGVISATDSLTKEATAENADAPEVASGVTPEWTNAYQADPVSVSILVKKTINLPEDKTGEFKFRLAPASSENQGPTNPASDPVKDGKDITLTLKGSADDKVSVQGSFDGLQYTEEGTYHYRMRELKENHLPGVSYSAAVYAVTVDVTREADALKATTSVKRVHDDNGHDASADLGKDEPAVFTNTYSETAAQYRITGTKWVNNNGKIEPPANGRYQFKLEGVDGAPMPKGATDNTVTATAHEGVFTFDAIEFGEGNLGDATEKTFSYKLTEVKEGEDDDPNTDGFQQGGMTYDASVYTVQLKLHKVDGALTVTPTYVKDGEPWNDGQHTTPVFTNVYAPKPVEAEIKGSKTLTGREWKADDSFEFTLTADEATMQAIQGGTVTKEDGTALTMPMSVTVAGGADGGTDPQNFSFGTFKFAKAGTYTFTVTEKQPSGQTNGLTYDNKIWTVTVAVTDEYADGKLTGMLKLSLEYTQNGTTGAVERGTEEKGAAFVNTYSAQEVSVMLGATKKLTGRPLVYGEFNFVVKDNAGDVVATAENLETGRVRFSSIAFTKAGEYWYTMHEVAPENASTSMKYDETVYKAKVVVTDDGKGALKATVTYCDTQDIPLENNAAPTFNNTFTAAPATATIEGSKTLEGREWKQGDSFGFELNADEKTAQAIQDGTVTKDDGSKLTMPMEATVTGADGDTATKDFSFEKLKFSKAGTYTFTVKETVPADDAKVPGVTYDTNTWTVTVTVSDKDGKDNVLDALVAKVSYAKDAPATTAGEADAPEPAPSKASFTNVYAASGTLQLDGTKVFEGRELTEADNDLAFTFKLLPADAEGSSKTATAITKGEITYGADKGVVTVTGAQLREATTKQTVGFKFDDLTFTKAAAADDPYRFKIVEESVPNGQPTNGITYDPHEYVVNVTATDGGEGKLTVTATAPEGSTAQNTWTNTYSTTKTSVALEARKELSGRELKGGEFTFVLKGEQGEEPQSKTNGSDGAVAFDAIEYTKAGDYTYTITEVAGDDPRVTYDTTTYKVHVKVTDNNAGALSATPTYKKVVMKDGVETEEELGNEEEFPTFKNVYMPPVIPPDPDPEPKPDPDPDPEPDPDPDPENPDPDPDPENPDKPTDPENPDQPTDPENPGTPSEPGQPSNPDTPSDNGKAPDASADGKAPAIIATNDTAMRLAIGLTVLAAAAAVVAAVCLRGKNRNRR